MKLRTLSLLSLLTVGGLHLQAQDDLLNSIETKSNEPVIATFKSSRIINAHTVETVRKRNLDFRVAHRFGNIATNGSRYTAYGLDNSADINIAFEYGVTDNFTVGLSRSKSHGAFNGNLKYRVLHQTESNSVPVSITLYHNTSLLSEKTYSGESPAYGFDTYTDRLSYVNQVIIAKKFSEGFSFEIIPTHIHRNWVFDPKDENDNFALGFGGRIKLTKRSALVADAFYTFSKFRKDRKGIYLMPPVALGWEVETGGHVFTIMFSNAAALIENDFLVNTKESWGKGQIKLSFNISRTFDI